MFDHLRLAERDVVAPYDQDLVDDVCLSLPCILGAGGVERIIEPAIDGQERAGLNASAETLRRAWETLNQPKTSD